MRTDRSISNTSSIPVPTLDHALSSHVILIEHRGREILSQEEIAQDSPRLPGAMNRLAARPKDHAIYCACVAANLPRLCLRSYRETQLLLVCTPNSKFRHALGCHYHGGTVVTAPVLARLPSRHDVNWRRAIDAPQPIAKVARTRRRNGSDHLMPRPKPPGARRHARSTLASSLLHATDAAKLNVYVPSTDPVAPESILRRLAEVLGPTQDGADSRRRMFVLGADIDPSLTQLQEAIEDNSETIVPIVIVAELMRVSPERGGMLLGLRNCRHDIRVRSSQWEYARYHSASRATTAALSGLSGPSPSGMRVIVLMHVVPDADGRLEAKRVGLIVANAQGIPVESSYELALADRLVSLGRNFIKPLFRKDDYPYLHDFVLIDAGEPFYIEVNGMENDAYIESKEKSIGYLEKTAPGRYIAWWVSDGPFPADKLPPARA